MNPLIVVMSYGETNPDEIVNNIIKANGSSKTKANLTISSVTFPTFLTDINTKYYKTTVEFLPIEGNINSVSSEVWERAESLIIYFNALNISFLKNLLPICDLIQNNSIGMGLLLTDKLYEKSNEGITYTDIKSICEITLDIIELQSENVESCQDAQTTYEEVSNTLMNNIWSNVHVAETESGRSGSNSALDTESQLDAFENLISGIKNFKKTSSTLKREELLDQAEKLAELFACVLTED